MPNHSTRRVVLKVRRVAANFRDTVRGRARGPQASVPLEQVERRLELLLAGLFGRSISIAPADVKPSTWIERVRRRLSRVPRAAESTPSIDGETIRLPAALSARAGIDHAVARYRLLAIEQAARLVRGSASHAPLHDPIERDLYLLREGMVVDAQIVRAHPGVVDALVTERRAALERRPKLDALTRPERDVELLVRQELSLDPREQIALEGDAAASLAWARETAARIRDERATYRGLPPATLWGTIQYSGDATSAARSPLPTEAPQPRRVSMPATSTGWRRSRSRDSRVGTSETQDADTIGKMVDPFATADKNAPENPEGRETSEAGTHAPKSNPPHLRTALSDSASGAAGSAPATLKSDNDTRSAIQYPEWDSNAGRYLPRAVAVRICEPTESDDAWSTDALRRHAALVRQVRHQFERLRARRMLLSRQRAGDDLDLTACVHAFVDRRIGRPADDRLYLDARPARRGLAISLLVDVSGSTKTLVSDGLRIIDLEKLAVLLASEALDALGDLYAVSTFTGKSAANVKVTTLKGFRERGDEVFRRRVAALEPGGFTRLGAAVRHATQQLAAQSAGHRLLLILSDGRPTDIDQYQGIYGVEDSRHAIFEAQASGVYPFCLTVDRDASEYLPRIFGQAGHTILQRPEQLPTALLNAVRALIRR
jgi:nitric oxide reductase NorD protein